MNFTHLPTPTKLSQTSLKHCTIKKIMHHNLTCLLNWQSWQVCGLSLGAVMGNYCWHTIRPGKVYESSCVQYGCLLISSCCQGESKAKGKRPWLPWQHKSDSDSQDSLLLISFQPQISFHSAAIINRKYYGMYY